MAGRKGLHWAYNRRPKDGDQFIKKIIYRYIPLFDTFSIRTRRKTKVTTYIELEIYQFDICVVSFYNKGYGNSDTKYKVRCHLSPGHIKAIMKACLHCFNEQRETVDHLALVFAGADDENDHTEMNQRYQVYDRFLQDNFTDLDLYEINGSTQFNSFIFIHQDHPNKDECHLFFEAFLQKVAENLTDGNHSNTRRRSGMM
ncbi:MAG: hypothetical protein AAF620_20210 [Bacteroidota bacterium]